MTAIYDKPVQAPIKKGDRLGVVKIEIPGQPQTEIPLLADKDVEKLGFFGKIAENFRYILFGKN